jgi:hypothetical protein
MIASQSKYMVVGNGRIPSLDTLRDIPSTKIDHISIILPEWFRTYTGKKIIKVYGTQLYSVLLPAVDGVQYQFDTDIPLEATLHSNIARESNTGILIEPYPDVPVLPPTPVPPVFYNPEGPSSENINELYDGYVLTVNNFYTPKTYEHTDPTLIELQFWFKNRYGVRLPVFYVYNEDDNHVANFLLFKIECELLTVP